MRVFRGLFLFLALCPAIAAAQQSVQQQAQSALNNAQVFSGYTVPNAEAVLNTQIQTNGAQTTMTPQQLQTTGTVAASGDPHYQLLNQNATNWSIQNAPSGNLGVADTATASPTSIVTNTAFSTGGGACTVTNFASSPPITRTCDTYRIQAPESCTSTASITVIRTEAYQCHLTPTGPDCSALQNSGLCTQTSNLCTLTDATGACVERIADYSCSSTAPMTFTAPQIGATSWAPPVVTWSQTCTPGYTPQSCYNPVLSCPGGSTIQDVNGTQVPMPCMSEVTSYTCATASYDSSACNVFANSSGCSLQGSSCFSVDPDGVCATFENTYQCGSATTTAFNSTCQNVNVCVGGVCQSVPQSQNTDLPLALASIDMLNTMAAEWDVPGSSLNQLITQITSGAQTATGLEYFNSTVMACRDAILNTYNCCSSSGWAIGVFVGCSQQEVQLAAALQNNTAVYVRTYCSSRALFFCLEKSREYCVFNSAIAKEINFQAQQQLYSNFTCRALTHAELSQIDWSQIDLTPVFGDMMSNVQGITNSNLVGLIQNNILLSQPTVQGNYP